MNQILMEEIMNLIEEMMNQIHMEEIINQILMEEMINQIEDMNNQILMEQIMNLIEMIDPQEIKQIIIIIGYIVDLIDMGQIMRIID